jgi:hypothetical protein
MNVNKFTNEKKQDMNNSSTNGHFLPVIRTRRSSMSMLMTDRPSAGITSVPGATVAIVLPDRTFTSARKSMYLKKSQSEKKLGQRRGTSYNEDSLNDILNRHTMDVFDTSKHKFIL